MRKSFHLSKCLLVTLALSLLTCEPEERISPETSGSLLLGIELPENSAFAGRIAANDKLSILITIENESGEITLDQEVLKLIKLNKEYVTKPISLISGNYKIIEFMVINDQDEVIYMTPKEGSPLSYLVDHPVPILFSVTKNIITKLAPEVITTISKSPKDFGYSSFTYDFLETFDFLIAIFTSNLHTGEYQLTNANLQILADGNLVFDSLLNAGSVKVTIPSNYTEYQLKITKTNYQTYSSSFSENELALHFDNDDLGPLQIYLCGEIITEDGLILWNKLGSEEEVKMSEFGPPLSFGDNIYEFVPGTIGNGVTIREGTYYNMQRHRNIIFENLPEYLNTEAGTIECYFKANEVPVPYSHNAYRIFDGAYGLEAGIGLHYFGNDVDYNSNDLTFYITLGGKDCVISYYGFEIQGHIGKWVHVAAVWDRKGINGSQETMRIYINNEVVAAGTANDWGTTFGNSADIASGNDSNIAGKFYLDELRVYSVAKTDFSNRLSDL